MNPFAGLPRSLTPEDQGKRVLVRVAPTYRARPICTRVKEFSPSAQYVCLGGSGVDVQYLGWLEVAHVELVEVLPEREG
jgi:hypothetical protein